MQETRRKATAAVKPDIEINAHQSLSAMILVWLRKAILSGVLAPGQVLRQEELAARFKTSRVPLREALQHLEAEGLVISRPRRGYAVTALDGEQLVELLQLRILIESYAGYAGTLRRTEEDVAAVELLLHAMDKLPNKTGREAQNLRWSTLNRQFHSAIFSASRLSHLCRTSDNIAAKIEPYILIDIAMTHTLGEAQSDHHGIFKAFKEGDADQVAVLSRRHCESTAVRFIACLQERGLVPGITPEQITNLGPAAAMAVPAIVAARPAAEPVFAPKPRKRAGAGG